MLSIRQAGRSGGHKARTSSTPFCLHLPAAFQYMLVLRGEVPPPTEHLTPARPAPTLPATACSVRRCCSTAWRPPSRLPQNETSRRAAARWCNTPSSVDSSPARWCNMPWHCHGGVTWTGQLADQRDFGTARRVTCCPRPFAWRRVAHRRRRVVQSRAGRVRAAHAGVIANARGSPRSWPRWRRARLRAL